MIKVLIADNNPYYKLGIKEAIEKETSDIKIIAMSGSGEETIKKVLKQKPDVVMLSSVIAGYDCYETQKKIREISRSTKIICLCHEKTIYDDPQSLLNLNSDSYIEYDIPMVGLLYIIRTVIQGKRSLSPEMGIKLLEKFREAQQKISAQDQKSLTKRQIEILSLAAQGLSNREIAGKLFIAENTVKTQMSTIIRKLNMPNRQRAAVYALEKNIIPKSD